MSTLSEKDILTLISESLDPDEIVDRLNISPKDLCSILASDILSDLDKFYDIYHEDEFNIDNEESE